MSQHGGKREGAGRPATGAKPVRAIRLDDQEHETVKQFVKNMREAQTMKNVSELKRSEGTLLECSREIVEGIITENKWEGTFIPRALEMSDEIRMSVINTYDAMVANNINIRLVRQVLDGVIIPHIKE